MSGRGGRAHSLLRVMRVNPFSRRRNAERSQAKARCGDARHVAVIFVEQRAVCAGAVRNKPCVRIGLLPEVTKHAPLKVFEKCIVTRSERILIGAQRLCRMDVEERGIYEDEEEEYENKR